MFLLRVTVSAVMFELSILLFIPTVGRGRVDEGEGLRAGGSNFATRTVHARSIMCVDAQLSDRRTVGETATPTFTNFTHTPS